VEESESSRPLQAGCKIKETLVERTAHFGREEAPHFPRPRGVFSSLMALEWIGLGPPSLSKVSPSSLW
jgi:hypothetical protein